MTQVRVVVQSLEGFTERLMSRLALNVTALLVKDTPVDTGWARANWVPSIGAPRERTAGTRAAAEAGQVDLAPQVRGQAEVAGYKLGPAIFISNNVPYIKRLNSGSSRQAPAGFVQSAIFRGIRNTVLRSRQ